MRGISAMLLKRATRTVAMSVTGLSLSVSALAQTVYYVSTTGNDANNGLSWATAKRTIQGAINAARAGDEIRVAQGTYGAININKNLALKGGYAGTGPDPDARDFVQFATIIDGGGTATAIQFSSGLNPLIEGFIIQNGFSNQASRAGGISSSSGSPTIRYNLFRNNRGTSAGGAIRIYEGAPVIEYNVFENNSISTATLAENANGAAIYIYTNRGALIRYNIFVNNVVSHTNNGGARGGAIYTYTSDGAVIANNLFVNNRATSSNANQARGGAIWIYEGTGASIYNNTFVGNAAQVGSAIWSNQTPMAIRNNIFAGYTTAAITHNGSSNASATADYNCFFASITQHGSGAGTRLGDNNLYQDPQFVDAANGDYRLSPTSPCIDAGDSSVVNWDTDLAGNPRIQGSAVDIGAFEFTAGGGGPEGDVNGDGCVDDADLLTVLFAFGQSGSNPADVNRDGIVDDADLLIVLFNFGQGC